MRMITKVTIYKLCIYRFLYLILVKVTQLGQLKKKNNNWHLHNKRHVFSDHGCDDIFIWIVNVIFLLYHEVSDERAAYKKIGGLKLPPWSCVELARI